MCPSVCLSRQRRVPLEPGPLAAQSTAPRQKFGGRPLAVPPLRLTDPAASRTDALGYNSIMRGARLARHLLLPLLAILVLFTPVTEARVRDFLRTTGANKIAIRVKPVMVSSAKHQPDRKKKGQKSFDQPKVHRSHYPLASGVALIWSAACSGVAR